MALIDSYPPGNLMVYELRLPVVEVLGLGWPTLGLIIYLHVSWAPHELHGNTKLAMPNVVLLYRGRGIQ